jgi:ABC-type hemin transport system ATPase subunit
MCDRVVVLGADGRVAASGAAGEVLTGATLEPVFGVRFEQATALVPARP